MASTLPPVTTQAATNELSATPRPWRDEWYQQLDRLLDAATQPR